MSRRPLRGSELGAEPVAVPLRPLPPRRRPALTTPAAVMDAARMDAEELLETAEESAGQARDAAYREGLEAGHAHAAGELRAALEVARELCAALERRHVDLEAEAVPAAVALALEIAARVVRAEVAARPERVTDVLRGAIRRATDRERLVARVNPADLAICREAAPDVMAELGGIGRLDFVDDRRVGPGGCVLETNAGDVDATLSTQFARIQEALLAPPDASLVQG